MDRRQFLADSLTGTATLGAAAVLAQPGTTAAQATQRPKPKPALMKVGHQHHSADPELRVMAALGVNNICSALRSREFDDEWSVAGLKRLRERVESFGSRGKIFNVHFRNIKGRFLNFQETFPDDGDVDMLQALRVYREVGYDGTIMPDHAPSIDGDTNGSQAFAYAFGYIQALIQMVKSEGATA